MFNPSKSPGDNAKMNPSSVYKEEKNSPGVSHNSKKERKNRSGIPGAIGQSIIKLEKHYVTVMGANIRYFRTKRGLRLIDLASEAGITQSYLYKIENAYFDCNPSISVLIRLAAVLDVAPFSLFVDFEELSDKNVFDAYFENDTTDVSMVAEDTQEKDYGIPYLRKIRPFGDDENGLSALVTR